MRWNQNKLISVFYPKGSTVTGFGVVCAAVVFLASGPVKQCLTLFPFTLYVWQMVLGTAFGLETGFFLEAAF